MAKQNNMAVPQHKRLACGDTIKGYAKGGTVEASPTKISPLTQARRNNGIKGMKTGGKVE